MKTLLTLLVVVAVMAISMSGLAAYSLEGADQYLGFANNATAGARILDGDDPEIRLANGFAVDGGEAGPNGPSYNKGPVYEAVGVGNGWAAAMLPYTNQNIIGLTSGVPQSLTNSVTVYVQFQYTASVVDNYAAFTRLGMFGRDKMFRVNLRPSWWAGAGSEYDFLEIMVNDGAPGGTTEYSLTQNGGNAIPSVVPNQWYELALTYARNTGTNMATAAAYIRTTGMGTNWTLLDSETKADAVGLYQPPVPAGRTAINTALFATGDHDNDWWTAYKFTDQGKFESYAMWDVALSEADLNGLTIAIPEPGSMLLIGMGLVALLRKKS